MNQLRRVVVVSILSLLTVPFTSAAAQSDAAAETLREIAACRDIEKNKARLKCFDRAAQSLSAESSSLSALTTAQASTAEEDEADVDPDAAFGAEQLVERARERKVEKKDLHALATSISKSRGGKYIIRLENGQVWRQIQGDTNTLRIFGDKEKSREVIIKKRLLGYALRLTSSKRSILVRRIK